MMDERIPADLAHLFVRSRRLRNDDVFDSWVAWFEFKGVPYRVVMSESGRRILYKHQVHICADTIVPCCNDFNMAIEGRKWDEVHRYGFKTHLLAKTRGARGWIGGSARD